MLRVEVISLLMAVAFALAIIVVVAAVRGNFLPRQRPLFPWKKRPGDPPTMEQPVRRRSTAREREQRAREAGEPNSGNETPRRRDRRTA